MLIMIMNVIVIVIVIVYRCDVVSVCVCVFLYEGNGTIRSWRANKYKNQFICICCERNSKSLQVYPPDNLMKLKDVGIVMGLPAFRPWLSASSMFSAASLHTPNAV